MTPPRPWRWQRLLIEILVPHGSTVAGELEELFARRRARDGSLAAHAWHTRQVIALVVRAPTLRRAAATDGRRPAGGGMTGLWGDVRFAWRGVSKSAGFTAAAAASLALGIGATTTVFSVTNGLLLRPLPAGEPERLVRIGTSRGGSGFQGVSYPESRELETLPALDGLLVHVPQTAVVTVGGEPSEEMLELVSGNYFDVLRVRPRLGRGFLAEEDVVPGRDAVVVISDGLWQRRLGGDPSVIGGVLHLNGHAFTVVGVAPPDFPGTFRGFRIDLWVPVMMRATAVPGAPPLEGRADRFLMPIGRLAEGATPEELRAQVAGLSASLRAAYPDANEGVDLLVAEASGIHPFLASVLSAFLAMLLGAVALVLLVACANVALLLLARATARQREMAVRISLGASRGRVLRMLLAEGLLLGALGGTLGLALAAALTAAAPRLIPGSSIPLAVDVAPDARVVAFTLLTVMGAVVAFALAPALQATRAGVEASLRGGASRPTVRRGLLGRRLLVALQVGVSCVLLVGSALLLQSLRNSALLDPGFVTNDQWVLSTNMEALGYGEHDARRVWDEAVATARAHPAVTEAALGLFVPLGDRGSEVTLVVPDAADPAPVGTSYNTVADGYFDALGIPLVEGRDFAAGDSAAAAAAVIVNETLARQRWPGASALGRRILVGAPGPGQREATVVGVAADIRYRTLGEAPRPFVYLSWAGWFRHDMRLHARVGGPGADPLATVVARLRAIDPDLPVRITRLEEEMAFSLTPTRVAGSVLTFAGLGALLLAGTGLFGLLSYTVARRRREIGIRMALGSGRDALTRMVLRDGLSLVAAGLVPGLVVALLAARLLRSFLYGVGAADPVTFAAVSALLLGIAALAAWVPAQRAGRVEPMRVLADE